MGGSEDEGARLLPVVLSDRTKGNKQKLMYRTSSLDTGKTISHESDLTLEQTESFWSSILGGIQDLTSHSPEQPTQDEVQ